MTIILTIETTCDETAAALVTDELKVLADVVASQDKLHERYGGVVPEVASRVHLEQILPVIDSVFSQSGIKAEEIDAIAVANMPGLAGSLLVGLSAAKSLAVALEKPLIAINHLQAHIYACKISSHEDPFPCLGLIISGGHTSIYHCVNSIEFVLLGGTIDDAVGEAFDKVAAMLNLPYPGGPSIQKIAVKGNPHAYNFPRSLLNEPDRISFSFSGLKTAVRYKLVGPGKVNDPAKTAAQLPPNEIADIAASFQEAAVDILVGKTLQVMKKSEIKTLCIGGGAAANKRFREKISEAMQKNKYKLFIAPPNLCTDNAIMGAIAVERYKKGLFESLELDAFPGVIR
ncbi:MAG: tRNA (adenosine(37)-N6)-threonylcarbamoyltransferase complex transferase subunit TsaD [Planctomycetaceae bacterium]|jgi:N6-L-threonylcarbamoyladenine synthase|nr:tRNA (adenosine(37)-N6)-threonylcarbamoyltransferase complex transferase subunit TsaD [Planctomycetaceae bacterium]